MTPSLPFFLAGKGHVSGDSGHVTNIKIPVAHVTSLMHNTAATKILLTMTVSHNEKTRQG